MQKVSLDRPMFFITMPAICIASVLAGLYFLPTLIHLNYIHWLFVVGCIFLLIWPFQQQPLALPKEASLWQCGVWITLFHLAVLGLYWGIAQIASLWLPILTPPHPHLFSDSLHLFIYQWGLFPWSLMAFVAVMFRFTVQRTCQSVHVSDLVKPITHSTSEERVGTLINMGIRLIIFHCIGLTLLFTALLGAWMILNALGKGLPLHGFTIPVIFGTLLMLVMLNLKRTGGRYLTYLAHLSSTRLIFLLLLISLILAVVLFSWLFNFPTDLQAQLPPIVLQLDWKTCWYLLSVMYLSGWGLMGGLLVARLMKGYTPRTIVLITVLPIIVLFIVCDHVSFLQLHLSDTVKGLLPLLSFVILLLYLPPVRHLSSLFEFYLPVSEAKFRFPRGFLVNVWRIALVEFCLYLPAGIRILAMIFMPLYTVFLGTLLLIGITYFVVNKKALSK